MRNTMYDAMLTVWASTTTHLWGVSWELGWYDRHPDAYDSRRISELHRESNQALRQAIAATAALDWISESVDLWID